MQAWKTGWWRWWEEAKVVVVMVEVVAAVALAASGEGSRVGGRRSRHELPWQVHYLLHVDRVHTHTPYSHIRPYIYTHHTRTHTKNDTSSLRVFRQTRDKRIFLFPHLYFFSFFSVTFSSRFLFRFRAFPSASRLARSDIARFSPLSRVGFVYARASFDWLEKNQQKDRSKVSHGISPWSVCSKIDKWSARWRTIKKQTTRARIPSGPAMQTPHSLRKFEDEKEPWRKRMSTWSRITVSCLVSLSNQPSVVIARTLYGKSFKFSRRHRIRMRVPSHFCDILFLRIIALFFFFLLPFFSIDYLFHSRSNISSFFCPIPFKISSYFFLFSFSPFSIWHVYFFLFLCSLIIYKSSGR